MTATERGLLKLYGLKSLDEATAENWPWCFRDQYFLPLRKFFPKKDNAFSLITIVEKLRSFRLDEHDEGFYLHCGSLGYDVFYYMAGEEAFGVYQQPNLSDAVRAALEWLGRDEE